MRFAAENKRDKYLERDKKADIDHHKFNRRCSQSVALVSNNEADSA